MQNSVLTVGGTYKIYTRYESISDIECKVVGTLAFSETPKVPFNINVLAINERVISYKDEDLESYIGEDTIYHLRAIKANPDGKYSEYIIWDSIINKDKTTNTGKKYKFDLDISIREYNISTFISEIDKFMKDKFGNKVEYSLKPASNADENGVVIDKNEELRGKLERAENVINSLNKLNDSLLPVAEAIINSDIVNKTNAAIEQVKRLDGKVAIMAKYM